VRITGDWKVILPPIPVVAEVLILPLRVVFPVVEFRVTFPPVPVPPEVEVTVPVVMLPPDVERAIAPPFP